MINLQKYNTLKIKKYILLGIISVTLLIIFFSYSYTDILITTRHGMDLWGILFDGNIRDFYQIVEAYHPKTFVFVPAIYNIMIYIIFAVWNIPLVILEVFFNVDVMDNILCVSWIKLLPIIFFALTSIVLYKITEELKWEKKLAKLSIFLYTSSILAIAPVFIISQYDSIGLFFSMLGVLSFFKGNHKKFILWFAISFCFKLFAIFVFVPLLLIKEKRIFIIIRDFFIVISLYILTTVLFTSPETTTQVSFIQDMMYKVFQQETKNLNFTIIILTLICTYSYIFKTDSIEYRNNFSLWAIFVSSGAFFIFSFIYPYWIILLLPFLILIITQDKSKLKNNLLLELILSAVIVIEQLIVFHGVYWDIALKSILFEKIIPDIVNVFEIYNNSNSILVTILKRGSILLKFLYSIKVAIFLGIVVYNRPRIQEKIRTTDAVLDRECWEVLIIRTLIFCLLGLLPILSLVI